jgi:hypothetical protein
MSKWIVTINGHGDLNGVVLINKTVEMDANQARLFNGAGRERAIEAFIQTHYPGVKVDPKRIGINVKTKPKASNKNGLGGFAVGALAGAAIGSFTTSKTKKKESNIKSKDIPFSHELAEVVNIKFSSDIDDIKQKLDFIALHLSGYKWDLKDSQITKENNRALDKCLRQYKIGFDRLKTLTDEENTIEYYKKGLKKLRLKRALNKYWIFLFFAVLITTLYILSIFE